MPPDFIQTQQEVARRNFIHKYCVDRSAKIRWIRSIFFDDADQINTILDEQAAAIAETIANIGRELEARCEGDEKIICSAIRFKDKIWMGHRHMHAMEAMHGELSYTMNRKEMNEQQTDRDQGFVTSRGRYVGREEAWDIAEKAGQLNDLKNKTPGYLYSEDVW